MSIPALNWAFPIPISGPKKAVLLALADHADDAGLCWPSVKRLVLFSGIKERAVRNALRELEVDQLIATDRSKGRVSSNYVLALNKAYDAGLEAPEKPVNGRSTRHDMPPNPASGAIQPGISYRNPAPQVVNPARHAPEPLEPPIEPLKRTIIEPNAREHEARQRPKPRQKPSEERTPEFDAFWAAYPRKIDGPKKAIKPWNDAIAKASPSAIMAGLMRYPFNPRYLHMPSTWLNGEMWNWEQNTAPPTIIIEQTGKQQGDRSYFGEGFPDLYAPQPPPEYEIDATAEPQT